MWKSVKGCVIIQTKGRNPERFLNLLRREGIAASSVSFLERDRLRLSIAPGDFRRLRPIVRECGCRVHIERRFGPPFLLRRLLRRPVLLYGMLAILLLLLVGSRRILFIRVLGCERVPETVVHKALETQGIRRFDAYPAEKLLTVAERARVYDERIAWMGLALHGAILTVTIEETQPQIVTLDPDAVCDVVSVKDGVITELTVLEGAPAVSVGDEVTAGQVLISGVFMPETNETVEAPLRVHARGTVKAYVRYHAEAAASAEVMEPAESGRSEPYTALRLLGLTVLPSKTSFGQSEICGVSAVSLNDCMLPVTLVSGTQREITEKSRTRSQAEQMEQALYAAEQLAFLKVPKDARLVHKTSGVLERDGVQIGSVDIIAEESIGLTKEIAD